MSNGSPPALFAGLGATHEVFCVDRQDIPPVDWPNLEPKPIDWDEVIRQLQEEVRRPYRPPVYVMSQAQYKWLEDYFERR